MQRNVSAILSSKLFWFFISNTSTALRGNAYRLTPEFINPFPIKVIDLRNSQEVHLQNKIINFVDNLLALNKVLSSSILDLDVQQLRRKIDFCEGELNSIVYELYGFSEEEIGIIENR